MKPADLERRLATLESERTSKPASSILLELPERGYEPLFPVTIDENNTQQSITPKIVFENVTAALMLAERLLLVTENVDEFNELVKSSSLSGRKGSIFWPPSQYGQAKSAIADDGDGLGVFLVKQFMPTPPKDETLQTVKLLFRELLDERENAP